MLASRRILIVIAIAALACASMALLNGCGGGGGGTSSIVQPPTQTTSSPYSARFSVNAVTGDVTVTPSQTTGGTIGTAAVLTGTAVSFESSRLVDEGGNVGVKALQVRVTNQTHRQLQNARLLFGDIVNASAWSDLRSGVDVATVAGTGVAGYSDGHATSSALQRPAGVAVDSRGDVYIADTGNNRIRKLSGGALSTVAGDGTGASRSGLGAAAQLNAPTGIVYCPRDLSLYVTERNGNRVSRIDPAGYVCTIAGTGTAGSSNGTGEVATFNSPVGLATDGQNLFVVEGSGHRVRKISYTGTNPLSAASYTVSIVAGDGTAATVDGLGTGASFNGPHGIAYGTDGALYITEVSGGYVRRLDPATRAVNTIAGTGASGSDDGYGDAATFRKPTGIVALPNRGSGVSLIVAEYDGNAIRQLRLDAEGSASPLSARSWVVQTLAGSAPTSGYANGSGTAARFNAPRLLAADASGNVLIADYSNSALRRLRPTSGFFPLGVTTGDATSTESVVLANAAGLFPVMGSSPRPYLDCPDLAAGATSDPMTWSFTVPSDVTAFEFTVMLEAATDPYSPVEAVDGDDTGGTGTGRVYVRTVAGSISGVNGFIDGIGTNARFRCLVGLAVDEDGTIYGCDSENDSIRRIEPNGRVTTVAGVVGAGSGHVNGTGNLAKFNYPTGVAVIPESVFSSANFAAGTNTTFLVVADLDNRRIRLVRSPRDGWTSAQPLEPWNSYFYQVATIAGDGTSGYLNGRGDVAQFSAPGSVAVGPGGVIYVAERTGGNRVRCLQYTGGDPMSSTSWQVSLLAGSTTGESGYVDSSSSSARFYDPRGITVQPDGTVCVADTYNDCVRKITVDGTVSTLAGTNTHGYVDATGTAARFYHPWGIAAGRDGYLYVVDRYNYRIRRVSPTGVVTTVAGTGSTTTSDGHGNTTGHYDDLGIAVSPSGDLYVAEAECLRMIQRIIDTGDIASR